MKLLLLRFLWEKAEDNRLVQSGKEKAKGRFNSYFTEKYFKLFSKSAKTRKKQKQKPNRWYRKTFGTVSLIILQLGLPRTMRSIHFSMLLHDLSWLAQLWPTQWWECSGWLIKGSSSARILCSQNHLPVSKIQGW